MRLIDNPDANYYAYPLDLCAEVSEKLEVTKIYYLPSAENDQIRDDPRPFDQRKIRDTADSEYHPDLRPPPRQTTKPYQIIQPEGPSFTVEGKNNLRWEKWSLQIGFNYREGLTLHDVRYLMQTEIFCLTKHASPKN
jgi:primary-amine oxidase